MKRKSLVLFLLFFVSLALPIFAETEEAAPSEIPEGVVEEGSAQLFDSAFGLSLGTISIDGQVYSTINLNPEIAIGKFGLGVDIDFKFTFVDGSQFSVYPNDWYLPDGGTFWQYLNLYLSKFDYVRWGFENDPLYIRLGTLDSTTLGTGFIVNGYTNTMFEPEMKIFGGQMRLDGSLFNFPYFGVQLMVANWTAFDVMGGRFYIRPLAGTKVPVLKNLEIGTTWMFDTNPYYYMKDTDNDGFYDNTTIADGTKADSIMVWGVDAILPILTNKVFSLAVFGDYVNQNNNSGGMVGIGGDLFSFISYGFQIHFLGDDFAANFFNQTYDLDRAEKYALITNTGTPLQPAGAGFLGSAGFAFFENGLVLNFSLDGPFASPTESAADAPWQYPHLQGILLLDRSLLKVVDVAFWYDKQGIDTFAAVFSAEDAIIGGSISAYIDPAVIQLAVDVMYTPNNQEQWNVVTTLEAGIQF